MSEELPIEWVGLLLIVDITLDFILSFLSRFPRIPQPSVDIGVFHNAN